MYRHDCWSDKSKIIRDYRSIGLVDFDQAEYDILRPRHIREVARNAPIIRGDGSVSLEEANFRFIWLIE